MQNVVQEIAAYQREYEQLIAAWNALSSQARMMLWAEYTQLIDLGGAGYHRFAPLLVNAWCEGWDIDQPFGIAGLAAA
jgi:hypothetical protein